MKKPMTLGLDQWIDFQTAQCLLCMWPQIKTEKSWDDVPEDVKNTFDKLGIPEAKKKLTSRIWSPV